MSAHAAECAVLPQSVRCSGSSGLRSSSPIGGHSHWIIAWRHGDAIDRPNNIELGASHLAPLAVLSRPESPVYRVRVTKDRLSLGIEHSRGTVFGEAHPDPRRSSPRRCRTRQRNCARRQFDPFATRCSHTCPPWSPGCPQPSRRAPPDQRRLRNRRDRGREPLNRCGYRARCCGTVDAIAGYLNGPPARSTPGCNEYCATCSARRPGALADGFLTRRDPFRGAVVRGHAGILRSVVLGGCHAARSRPCVCCSAS
jgi:hypothetical protein